MFSKARQNWQFLAFLINFCPLKRSSLRSQCWMRLFWRFSNTVLCALVFKLFLKAKWNKRGASKICLTRHASSPWPPCFKTQKKENWANKTNLIIFDHKSIPQRIHPEKSCHFSATKYKETNASRLFLVFHLEASSSKSFKKTNLSRILLPDIWDFLKSYLFFMPFHLLWHILQKLFSTDFPRTFLNFLPPKFQL